MTEKTNYQNSKDLTAEHAATDEQAGSDKPSDLSPSKVLPAILFVLICASWIGLDNLTGQLYQAQILPACFIISCLLFFRFGGQ